MDLKDNHVVFTYWYTQWATKAVQNSPRIILLYWFVGLVGWCETRWIPIYLMMVNTLKWYPYNRTPCVQDVMVIFQLNYYCSIFFFFGIFIKSPRIKCMDDLEAQEKKREARNGFYS